MHTLPDLIPYTLGIAWPECHQLMTAKFHGRVDVCHYRSEMLVPPVRTMRCHESEAPQLGWFITHRTDRPFVAMD